MAARKKKAGKRRASTAKATAAKTKVNTEVMETVLRALRMGLDYESAAELVGVSSSALRDWRASDEEFAIQCRKAKAEGKMSVVVSLMKLIRAGNATAAIFWLKRRTVEFREEPPTFLRVIADEEEKGKDAA